MITSLWRRFGARRIAGRWTIEAALTRAAIVWREGGLNHLWFKILGETVYRRAELMERSLVEPRRAPTVAVTVEIAQLGEDEIDDYMKLRPDVDPAAVRARLTAGQRCFVARHDGHIIHASWSATGQAWIDYLEREIQLAPDEVYVYETYSAPAFRGRNVGTLRSACDTQFFRDAGYRRALAVVMPENASGMYWLKKCGYRRIGVVGYVKVGPWRWDFCRKAVNPMRQALR